MKPTTGRPRKFTVPITSTLVLALVTMPAPATLDRPTFTALVPVKLRRAQPFWKPVRTLTGCALSEPSTPEALVVGMWDWPLRMLSTVDSQHSASDTPGSDGEKSPSAAVAPDSSRLKNE